MLEQFASKCPDAMKQKDGDYLNEDGILCCGNCRTPKQIMIAGWLLPCMCKCVEARYKLEREAVKFRERQCAIDRERKEAFANLSLRNCTFDTDDMANHELRKLCCNYAKRFSPDTSMWLLLYGGTGVGKTYMAACIANAVIDKGYSVRFTTVSEFESKLWNSQGKAGLYDEYAKCGLLVVDDIGAERDSKYMSEILFNVIDRRLKSGKPLVATTNLSPNEIFKPTGTTSERIMSRLLERTVPYECKGNDRRLINFRKHAKESVERLLSDE